MTAYSVYKFKILRGLEYKQVVVKITKDQYAKLKKIQKRLNSNKHPKLHKKILLGFESLPNTNYLIPYNNLNLNNTLNFLIYIREIYQSKPYQKPFSKYIRNTINWFNFDILKKLPQIHQQAKEQYSSINFQPEEYIKKFMNKYKQSSHTNVIIDLKNNIKICEGFIEIEKKRKKAFEDQLKNYQRKK